LTPQDPRTVVAPAALESAAGRLRVLVVEDDNDARAALRMLLELWGCAVSEAADGDVGVTHALAHRPAVAVIDIGLPGLDGYAVAHRIREGLAGAPMFLIALTGYHEVEERALAGDTGFDAHMVKPLRLEPLMELLQRVAREIARSV
jgi:two-component system, sensor histidine kinase